MRQTKSGSTGPQELINFNGPLVIDTRNFTFDDARLAASHRNRRQSELKLDKEKTKGFRGRTGDLWVPHSKGENSAVVRLPLRVIPEAGDFVRQKVIEKYEQTDVDEGLYLAWAHFAGRQASRQVIQRFDGYRHDAQENYRRIHMGLGPDGEIERDRVEASGWAMNGLARYMVGLRGFVGIDQDAADNRKWIMPHYNKKYAAALGWAAQKLDAMPAWDFELTVKEAYYSERTRNIFWEEIEKSRKAAARAYSQELALHPDPIPLAAYDDDPRAYAYNYVDGEFIG